MSNSDKNSISTKILINGSAIEDSIEITDIDITCALNRISSAKLTIHDGSPALETFEVSSSDSFTPGHDIEIQAGFNDKTSTIFKGIVVSQSIYAKHDKSSSLIVECKDKALKMTIGRKSGAFIKQKDSEVMSTLASRNGLSASIKSTNPQLEQLVQYCATDWDFLMTRAEVNGMVAVTSNNELTVAPPNIGSSSDTLTFGVDIIEIDSTLTSNQQLDKVTANAWDYSSQQMISSSAATPSTPNQGNLTGEDLSKVLSPSSVNLVTTSNIETQSLANWASGKLLKSRLSKIQGTVKAYGNAAITPNKTVTFKGLGKRFDGDAYVSAVEHRITPGDWWTYITTGLNPQWFAEEVEASYLPAAGLIPGIRGLQNATVKAITEDPDNQIRIQVTVQSMTADSQSGELWARWIQPYSTNGAGFFFMPEIGDEVIVSFLNEDPRFPVILGSVYSSQNAPPTQPADGNPIKTIVSKEKLTIEMDDKNKVITMKTPGNNQMILSDQDEGITIKDQNGNQIVMNSSGIEIKSASNININASDQLTEKAASLSASYTGEAKLSSSASLTLSGLDVSITGDASVKASGPEAQISADGMLKLQGSLININ